MLKGIISVSRATQGCGEKPQKVLLPKSALCRDQEEIYESNEFKQDTGGTTQFPRHSVLIGKQKWGANCTEEDSYVSYLERPGRIFIGTASRFAKGVGHVWRYKLTLVGAERIYVCIVTKPVWLGRFCSVQSLKKISHFKCNVGLILIQEDSSSLMNKSCQGRQMEFDRICSWNSISIFIIIQLKCGHSGCSETGLLLGWIFLDGNCQMELDWICSGNSGNYCNLHTVFQILHHSCSNPSKLNYYLATEDASGRELGMVMLASQMGLYRSIWVFSELRHSQYKVGDQVAMAFWMCFHCWLFAWLILFWLWITRPNQFFWGSVTKPVFLGQCYQTRFSGAVFHWMQTSHPWSSTKTSSWPMGVTSLTDAEKFARLICGPHTKIQNYAARLPHVTEESFLLFVKGGCKQGRLSEIERCIENLLDQVKDSEKKRGNIQNPGRGIFVKGGNPKTVYYHSAQLTAKECTCRVVFGADTKQSHITTSCSQWEAGEQFESILDSVLTKNSYAICEEIHGSQPVWLQKAWHAVMNFNNHRENHGIDYHVDYSATYHPEDPIVSFSFGHGGVLTLRSLSGKKRDNAFPRGWRCSHHGRAFPRRISAWCS